MDDIAVHKRSRMRAGVWLAAGAVMATMYAINGIQASQPGAFVCAAGWAALGAAQAWESVSGVPSSGGGSAGSAPKYDRFARYVSVAALVVIAVGVAMRWA
jgi:hypothetical protein